MNLEIILTLKQRAKEMLSGDYTRKIGDEELYTIISEWENCYKEKEIYRKTNNEHAKDVLDIEKPYKELLDDSIPKSVIREKIEECKENAHKFYQKKGINTGCKFCNNACNWYSRCKLLKELLGDEQ